MVLVLFALSITVTVLKRWIQLKNNLSGFQYPSIQPFVIVIFLVDVRQYHALEDTRPEFLCPV